MLILITFVDHVIKTAEHAMVLHLVLNVTMEPFSLEATVSQLALMELCPLVANVIIVHDNAILAAVALITAHHAKMAPISPIMVNAFQFVQINQL